MYNLYKSNTVYYTDDSFYSSYPFPSEWIELFKTEKMKSAQKMERFTVDVNIRYEPVISARMLMPKEKTAKLKSSNASLLAAVSSNKEIATTQQKKIYLYNTNTTAGRKYKGLHKVKSFELANPFKLADKSPEHADSNAAEMSANIGKGAGATETTNTTFSKMRQELISELDWRVKHESNTFIIGKKHRSHPKSIMTKSDWSNNTSGVQISSAKSANETCEIKNPINVIYMKPKYHGKKDSSLYGTTFL